MRQFNFNVSPTYPNGAPPFLESPALHRWILVPAIALAAMTFVIVWLV